MGSCPPPEAQPRRHDLACQGELLAPVSPRPALAATLPRNEDPIRIGAQTPPPCRPCVRDRLSGSILPTNSRSQDGEDVLCRSSDGYVPPRIGLLLRGGVMGAARGARRPDEVGGRGWVVAQLLTGTRRTIRGSGSLHGGDRCGGYPRTGDASTTGGTARDGRQDAASARAESAVSLPASPFLRACLTPAQLPCDPAAMCH